MWTHGRDGSGTRCGGSATLSRAGQRVRGAAPSRARRCGTMWVPSHGVSDPPGPGLGPPGGGQRGVAHAMASLLAAVERAAATAARSQARAGIPILASAYPSSVNGAPCGTTGRVTSLRLHAHSKAVAWGKSVPGASSPVSSPGALVQAVAAALGIRSAPGGTSVHAARPGRTHPVAV